MAVVVDRAAVGELLEGGRAQLVEVLPRAEYDWAHLPGAVNLPLKELDGSAAGGLDRDRPVVVYCHDWLCDLSPRAARRLERLGLPEVYDYAAGKMDWIAGALPYEGHAALVLQAVRRDPVVADLEDPLQEVADRLIADPAGVAVVVDRDGVVEGLVGPRELKDAEPGVRAGQAMRFGVTTVRPSEELEGLGRRMERARVRHVVVTRPDGTLVGLYGLGDLRAPGWEPDLG
ncbi:rhodanese-like domain-containing protein [Nonomuraea pusilla]|uniref:Rhodanese-related sulfurtransferase n=1 Tax=Nonomuraea pusilla TaxID=46177 RepID=A0A1H7IEP9_9ACTN|nr:rhodanese-like domain-containing protein [Nonomuraea pusilla]SEK60976.1 Rhodanese-related sulfurtransferase [Nonomuraea pusilla]